MRGVELVDGELEAGEVPAREHGRIVTRLIMLLGPWLERSGGGELLSQDNRVRIGPRRVRKPDLVLVRRADDPVFEEETLVSRPFIIVEIITKPARDEHRDRVTKLPTTSRRVRSSTGSSIRTSIDSRSTRWPTGCSEHVASSKRMTSWSATSSASMALRSAPQR